MIGETVVIVTPAKDADAYSGDPATDESEVAVDGVAVEPRPSSEPQQDARNAVTSGFTLYLPAGTVIGPENAVRVRGGTFSVLGEPAVWRSPFTGWEPGVIVQCERTEG